MKRIGGGLGLLVGIAAASLSLTTRAHGAPATFELEGAAGVSSRFPALL